MRSNMPCSTSCARTTSAFITRPPSEADTVGAGGACSCAKRISGIGRDGTGAHRCGDLRGDAAGEVGVGGVGRSLRRLARNLRRPARRPRCWLRLRRRRGRRSDFRMRADGVSDGVGGGGGLEQPGAEVGCGAWRLARAAQHGLQLAALQPVDELDRRAVPDDGERLCVAVGCRAGAVERRAVGVDPQPRLLLRRGTRAVQPLVLLPAGGSISPRVQAGPNPAAPPLSPSERAAVGLPIAPSCGQRRRVRPRGKLRERARERAGLPLARLRTG